MLRLTLFAKKEPKTKRVVEKAAQLEKCRIVRKTPSSVQTATCFVMEANPSATRG